MAFFGREEGKREEKIGSRLRHGKVRLRVRLDHQVNFGEQVVVLGSSKELGLWKKKVPLNWTEGGWTCELELRGGDGMEFKFVILEKDQQKMAWEDGNNRVLNLPKGGRYEMVCHWNMTEEAVNLLPFGSEENVEEFGDETENGSTVVDVDPSLEVDTSPFVQQWQGVDISFMRSNEHRSRERERNWDTSGLEGLALKLVEGDQNARNWWRKV